MADTKVSNFPPSAGLLLTDIFPVVDDPGGTPEAQKATFAQLQTLLSTGGPFVLKAGDTMTGTLVHPDGTAALPSIAFTGDLNTGVFHPTADTFGIATAGIEQVRVDPLGKVGVGTTLPTAKVDVREGTGAFKVSQLGNANLVDVVRSNASLNSAGFVLGRYNFSGTADAFATVQVGARITSATEGDGTNTWQSTPCANLIFSTTPNINGSPPLERVRIAASGLMTTLDVSSNNGTLTVASAPVLTLGQTWNNAAVTFTNFLSNVTNTASNANSNLFNFQVGAVDRFNFTVGGTLRAVRQDASNSGLSFFLRKQGTVGDANGAVADNSIIYSINSSGFDGTSFQTGAQIISTVNGNWTVSNHGNQLALLAVASGTTSAITCLTVNGLDVVVSASLRLPYVAKTATYTAVAGDYTIDCTANTFTINLPTAVGITGRIYVVKNSGAGTITIDPSGAQTIDGLATATVVSGASVTTQSNGANWIII